MSDYLQGNADNAIAVPFSDDEKAANPAEELDDDSPTATPEERVTRKQKRQERLNGLIREGKQSKDELAALKLDSAKTREELAQLRGYLAAQPQQRASNDDGKDPYERRLDAVYEKQSNAFTSAQAEIKAGTFTAERQQYYEKIAREVESEKTRIHTEQVVDSRQAGNRVESAQQVWVQKYPEVYQNPNAFQYAQAKFQQRKALGEQPTNDMVDEIMNETLTTFRLGKKAAPSASDRSRMSGIPSTSSGGGARSTGVVMTPALTRMALAAHPDLPEKDAVKKWVDSTGKKLREKKVL